MSDVGKKCCVKLAWAGARVMHTQCRVTSGLGQPQVQLRSILCLMAAEN